MHPSDDPSADAPAQIEMPRYRCHKEVWALQIKKIDLPHAPLALSALITPVESGYAPFRVGVDYMAKHKPEVGGYYVKYTDGYESFSPREAFEEGYTLINTKRPTIEELEKILQEPDAEVHVNPDGSVSATRRG